MSPSTISFVVMAMDIISGCMGEMYISFMELSTNVRNQRAGARPSMGGVISASCPAAGFELITSIQTMTSELRTYIVPGPLVSLLHIGIVQRGILTIQPVKRSRSDLFRFQIFFGESVTSGHKGFIPNNPI
jgi:hypothetical protein